MIICDDHIIEDPYSVESINEINCKKNLKNWIQENSDKVNLITPHMIKTREHQHWKVRLQLVSSCEILLNKCTR